MRKLFLFALLATTLVAAAMSIRLSDTGSVAAYFAPITAHAAPIVSYFARSWANNIASSQPAVPVFKTETPAPMPVAPPPAVGRTVSPPDSEPRIPAPEAVAPPPAVGRTVSPPDSEPRIPAPEAVAPPPERNEITPEPWMAMRLAETLVPDSNDRAEIIADPQKLTPPETAETPPAQEQKKEKPAPIIEVRLRQPGEAAKAETEDRTQLAALEEKVDGLRADMLRLQQTFDMYSGNQLADLKTENEQLRQEIRQLYQVNKITGAKVPTPNKALVDEILSEPGKAPDNEKAAESENAPPKAPEDAKAAEQAPTTPDANPDDASPDTAAKTPIAKPGSMEEKVLKEVTRWRNAKEAKKASGKDGKKAPSKDQPKSEKKPETPPATALATNKDGYQIVAEWGRTPEDAKAINKPEVSLKGMICVVPADTDDAHLTLIGRKLRHDFAGYNNLNIDVFDDVASAQQFDKGGSATGHHVLSVSKHPASDRDVILLIRGETTQEIPLDNGDAPPG